VLFATVVIVWGACPHATSAAQDAASPAQRPALLPATLAWETRLEPLPVAPAAHDEARVYVPLEDGALVALDRATGVQVWRMPATGSSTPLVEAGRVFVPGAGSLAALEGATGRHLWRVRVEGLEETASAAVAGSTIVVLTDRGLAALRVEDGGLLWAWALPDAASTGTVTAGAGAVFVTHPAGVAAIDLGDGTLRWQRSLAGVAGTPKLAGDRLLVGTADRSLAALSTASGDLAWRWRLGGAFVGAAVRDEVVYVVALDALLRAVRLDGGNQVWRRELPTRPVAPPVVRGGTIVLAGNDPVLATFDAGTGMPVARHVEPGDLLGPPLVAPEDGAAGPAGANDGVTIVLLFRDGRLVGLTREAPAEPTP